MSTSAVKQSMVGVVMAVLIASYAQAAVVVRKASDLDDNSIVHETGRIAAAVAAATVVYDQCDSVYHFTDDQKQRLKTRYEDLTQRYLKAYRDAYSHRVGVLPDQKIVDGYRKIIASRYQTSANRIAGFIAQKNGCKDDTVKSVVFYIDELNKADDDAAARAARTTPTE